MYFTLFNVANNKILYVGEKFLDCMLLFIPCDILFSHKEISKGNFLVKNFAVFFVLISHYSSVFKMNRN